MFRPNAPSFQLLLSILFSLLRDEPWFSKGGEGIEQFPKTIPAQQKLLKKYKESWEKMAQVRSTIILIFEKHYYNKNYLKKKCCISHDNQQP